MRTRGVSDEEEGRVCWEITRTSNFYSAKPPNQRAVPILLEESLQQQLILSYWKKIVNVLCRNCLPIAANRAHFALTPPSPHTPRTGGQRADPQPLPPARTSTRDAPLGAPFPSLATTPMKVAACPHFLRRAGGRMNYYQLTYESQHPLFLIFPGLSKPLR